MRFVKGTHLLFTASKDKTIKYWDADRSASIRSASIVFMLELYHYIDTLQVIRLGDVFRE